MKRKKYETDSDDDDDVIEILDDELDKARKVVEDQTMLLIQEEEALKQALSLAEKMRNRKKKGKKPTEFDNELDELLRRAKNLIGDQGMINGR